MTEAGGHLVGTAATAQAGRSHLTRIFGLLHELGGKTCPAEAIEEDTFRLREGYQNFILEPVEQDPPDTDLLTFTAGSDVNFAFFARTMQRTQLIGHFVHKGIEVPMHYSITGAIILHRENRKMRVWDAPKLSYSVLVPFNFLGRRDVLDKYATDSGIQIVDTGGDRPEYTQLRINAVHKSRELTLSMRAKLCSAWGMSVGQDLHKYLVLSGTVADVPNKLLGPNLVALARRVYVPWQNSQLLETQLTIGAYRRGQVMRLRNTAGDDPMPKYTWFVRMRSGAKADPEFGLLRCTCLADSPAEAIRKADAISARLIEERLPVSYPMEGWDKLIFPLKQCKDYLESLVPTRETVKSYFARA